MSEKIPTNLELMTLTEAAAYLKLKPAGVRWLYRTRRLPMFRHGRSLAITKGALDAYIQKRQHEAETT